MNDSRLIKWIDSLAQRGQQSSVYILEDDNIKRVFSYNSTWIFTTNLWSRRFFQKRKGYFFKVIELTIRTLLFVRKDRNDILVFHDFQNIAALILLCMMTNRKLLWDLHELPHPIFFRFKLFKQILRYMLQRVDLAIYTNEERRGYMIDRIGHKEKAYFILNNFNLETYYQAKVRNIPTEIESWQIEKRPYVIWLGAASRGRNFDRFLQAFLPFFQIYDLVILGSIEKDIQYLIDKDKLRDRIYSDYVSQDKIIDYIDGSSFSVVLYKNNTANNFYCEPNRLYQLVGRGKPVVVGNNPTMAKMILKHRVGIVLEDDGFNIEGLRNSISSLISDYTIFKENLEEVNFAKDFSWENQFEDLGKELNHLLG